MQLLHDAAQRPGVRLLHERLVGLVEHVLLGQRRVHPVVHDPGSGVEAEQVVDRRGQLEGALVAVPLHRTDPARVDHPGPEDPVGLLLQCPRPHGVRGRRVAHIGLRVGAGERAHRRDHPAVILEVVVAVGDVVLAGVDVLGGHLDAPVVGAHVVGGRRPVEPTAVGETAPHGVDLGQVVVIAPRARLDDLQDPGAVRPGLGAEDPRGGPSLVAVLGEVAQHVGAHEVQLLRLVEAGHEPHRVVQHRHDVGERVAEEAGDPHGHVDARSAELVERYDVQVADPS